LIRLVRRFSHSWFFLRNVSLVLAVEAPSDDLVASLPIRRLASSRSGSPFSAIVCLPPSLVCYFQSSLDYPGWRNGFTAYNGSDSSSFVFLHATPCGFVPVLSVFTRSCWVAKWLTAYNGSDSSSSVFCTQHLLASFL
jgi:hypothetical protein